MRSHGVRLNVGEIQVETDKHARFGPAAVQKCGVRRPAETFFRNSGSLESRLPQDRGKLCGEILVNLEFQAPYFNP